MKRLRWGRASFVSLVLLATTVSAWAQRAPRNARQQEDRKAIEQLHQKEIQASIALDVPALAALWTDDIVALPPQGPALEGRDATRRFFDDAAKKLGPYDVLGYNQDWREVYQIDDYALEWGFVSGRLRPAAGGEEVSFHYKVLRILKRQPDGSWRIHRLMWNPGDETSPPAAPTGTP